MRSEGGGVDAGGRLLDNLVLFGRLLRGAGLPVTPAQQADLARALTAVDLGRREEVRDAARAVLVGRRDHLELFERLFDRFWTRRAGEAIDAGRVLARPPESSTNLLGLVPPGEGGGADDDPPEERPRPTWSTREHLARRDFAELTPAELDQIHRAIAELDLDLAPRRTRRQAPARRGPGLDLRRTLRGSLRHGGEPLAIARRHRKVRPRPLVVLCDVSGSMELYTRVLLSFLYSAGRAVDRFEAFLFGTRLTRVTRLLAGRDVDRALARAAAAARDRGGGTRIGRTLHEFNRHWGRRVLGQGAVAAVISDGWDRGDPELLGREMARLHANTQRLIWLNPLLGSPGYEPLTRGLEAALPHVDDFLPVHNLASLEQLARALATLGPRRRLAVRSAMRADTAHA